MIAYGCPAEYRNCKRSLTFSDLRSEVTSIVSCSFRTHLASMLALSLALLVLFPSQSRVTHPLSDRCPLLPLLVSFLPVSTMSPPSVSYRLCPPRIHNLFLQRPRAASSLSPRFPSSQSTSSLVLTARTYPDRVKTLYELQNSFTTLRPVATRFGNPRQPEASLKLASRISPLIDARMRIRQGREASPPVWRCGNHFSNLIF